MIERVLLVVADTPGMVRTAAWVLKLGRTLSARVFAVSVIAQNDSSTVEERAWELLYGIEDDAFELNVKVSLLLEQGDQLDRLLTLSASYEVDLIVTSADIRLNPADLVRRAARPVVFVK
jgi:hypothetical protein